VNSIILYTYILLAGQFSPALLLKIIIPAGQR